MNIFYFLAPFTMYIKFSTFITTSYIPIEQRAPQGAPKNPRRRVFSLRRGF